MNQRRQSFPPELVEKVLDELVERNEVGALSKDAEENLKQCALVNWAFLSSSQRRLFNHVTLPSDKRYLSISHTLRNSPHIAGLIQSLHIYCKDDLSVEEIAQYEVLLQCRNLTLLFMENSIKVPLALEFYGRLLALPVLKKVCLVKMHSFPIRILRGCVALESLSLNRCWGVDLSVETQQNQGAGVPWMVPREIALSGFVLGVDDRRLNEFVRWSLSPASFFKFHNLKRLAAIPVLMLISEDTAEPVQDLINVTRNLEYLLLDSDYLACSLDFTPLTHLLHLKLDLSDIESDGTISADYIPSFLQSASGKLPSLEVLTLSCYERQGSKDWLMKFTTRQRWKKIDDAFREVQLPALRKVHIEALWHRSEMDPLGVIHEEVSYLRSKKDLLELTSSLY